VALHLKLAVASSSNKAFIEHVLKQLNMTEYFQAIASSEEVPRGKPDPAIFLLAASRLGIDPSECVVIEDGVSGMIGAKRAGMGCIGLVLEAETDTQKFPADVVVRSHDEITKQLLTQFGAI
jgi:HAD superfamily hydrolase (TIGR01509 family)